MSINKSADIIKSIGGSLQKRIPVATADGNLSTRLNSNHVGKRKRVRITTKETNITNRFGYTDSSRRNVDPSKDQFQRSNHSSQLSGVNSDFEQEYINHYQMEKEKRKSSLKTAGKSIAKNQSSRLNYVSSSKTISYPEILPPETQIRLNKYLANAGVCSRREADILIANGDICVNGEVIKELGHRVTPLDCVEYKGHRVESQSKVYVLLNKPKNCVTTSDDPECRLTVMDLVKNACTERIYPVGRLDRQTTGVLLITNDGALAAKLTHPSFMKKKIYHVWLDKPASIEDMQSIADGIHLEDGEIHADAISYVTEDDLSQVGIEIHSGRNRIVRRIFEHFGYRILKLDRVYFAGLTKKNLRRGQWRYLNEDEVNALRMGAFE